MQALNTSSKSTSRIEKLFNLIDYIAERRGRSFPQIVNIDKLRSLPIGTFGRIWADFLDKNNLQPFTTGLRRKQLHDGVHVLTGYGSDLLGEVELQAFLLGAKFTIANLMLGLGLLRTVYINLNCRKQFTWDRLWQAYQRGCNSQFDPDSWQPELLWDLPLSVAQSSVIKHGKM